MWHYILFHKENYPEKILIGVTQEPLSFINKYVDEHENVIPSALITEEENGNVSASLRLATGGGQLADIRSYPIHEVNCHVFLSIEDTRAFVEQN
jgi:hypothetical protein